MYRRSRALRVAALASRGRTLLFLAVPLLRRAGRKIAPTATAAGRAVFHPWGPTGKARRQAGSLGPPQVARVEHGHVGLARPRAVHFYRAVVVACWHKIAADGGGGGPRAIPGTRRAKPVAPKPGYLVHRRSSVLDVVALPSCGRAPFILIVPL